MENSTKKSGGVVIPKKKRSLDLKSLYESRSSEVGGSKKNNSGENEQKDVTKKRKSRKEISLNSLEPDAKKSRKDDGNGMKSEMGFREKLDMWSKELHGISLALDDNGSPFNIPKRPRGSVGRKMLESDQGSETWRISNSVDHMVSFKAGDRKLEDKGGPTDQLIKPITFSVGKDGALKSRLVVKSVDSQNKSKRKVESQSTMNSSGLSVKLNKVGSDEGVDRVGAFEPEVTKSEYKGGPNDQSVRSVTLSSHVTGEVIGLNKKSKRKGDPKYTMNPSSLNMKLKKVGADQGVNSMEAFEAEVTESEDKDGPIDQSVRSVTLSAGNDVAGKFVGYNKKSMRKADSKSTMNFRSSNVKSMKKVGSDEIIDHVGASEAEDTKSADKGCPDDQSVWSAIFSAGNDLEGRVFGVNRKSKRKADPKSTMNSSSINVKLKKRVGAKASDNVGAFVAEVTKSEDKDDRNDQSVRPVTLSVGNDVGGKVRGLNKKSKQKAGIKSTMKNSSSSNVKLKKKAGADEAIVCIGALEVEFTKSENKSGPNDQPVMPDTFYEDDDVAEKNIGLNKKSKQNAKHISTTNASSSSLKLNKGADEPVDRVGEIEAEVTISEDKGPIDQSVRPVNYTAGNGVARKLVGLNRKSKRKAHPKSTMNASSLNVKLKKVGADETFDFVGESAAEVIISEDRDVARKLVGVNKKSKRKADPKSTMNSSSSNVKLKKVGADESIDNVGAFVAEVTTYDDKGVTIDQSVRSDTLSACNDVVGKVAGVNKKSKRKANPRSTLNSNSSNMLLKKVGAGEAIDRVGAFEAEFTKSEDKDGRNEQLVRSVTLAAGQYGISNSKLAGKVIGSNTKSKRKADWQSTMTSSSSNKKSKVGADEDVVQVGAFKSEVTKPQDKGGPDDQLVGSVILSADKDGGSDLRLAGKVIGTNTKAKRKTDAKSTLNLSNSDAKLKQKVRADESEGGNYCQPDSVRHVVKESKVVVNNGNAPSKKRLSNIRKKKDLVVGGDSVEALVKMSEPAAGSSDPNSPFIDFLDEDDDDDDEENLEQNAARMLSSRFDPRCTGFTSKKKSSVSQMVDELSFPVSSARDSIRRWAKSLGDGASDSGDDNSRELRPRGDKGRSLSRKRRHFYDIPTRDLDPNWVLNRRIKIFWPLDESWYFGYVTGYHSEAKLHHLKYDDGEEEWVNLEEENFRLLLLRTEVPDKGISRRRSTAAKDTHAEQTDRPVDDASCIGDDDSEPIASWLATQSQRVKALSKSSQRRKKTQNYPSLGSLLSSEKTDNSNGDADASRPMEKKSGCESTSADKILVCGTVDKSQFVYVRKKFQKKRAGNSSVSKGGKARGSAPWPVTKRDMLGYGCVDVSDKQLRSFDGRSKLTLNDVLLESKEFKIQICLPLLPYLEFCWGIGFFRLFHDIFMLQHGVIVTSSPAVFLELLFVDSNIGLRSVLFEGCLIQGLAIVFLILTIFSHSDENCNGELKLPVTSIRFQLSSVHNLRKQHVFTFHSFFRLARSKWLYLESKIMQQCLLIKQLSVSECTYCNIKELESGILQPFKPRVGSEFSLREDFRKKFEPDNLPTGVSEEAFNAGMPANVPRFTLSFSAAPSLFLSLHLQSLMKHGFAGANFQHQDPLCSPESSGNGGSPLAECSQFTEHGNSQLDSEASAFRGLSSYQQDLEMDVVLAGNAIENANSSDKLHNGLSSDRQVDMPFDRKSCISIQTCDASWNAHDDFILNSNIMGPKGSLKRRKSSTISSLLGQNSLVLSDSQPNFMPHGFSNGPRKPRTQVQYTLPLLGYEICTRQETCSPGSIPCKRIRRASLRKIPDGSGNNPKSLELLTCSANVLITNDDRGWRECGAHIFSEVADDNEWRLAVKISGITKFSYKVKHILQPGSTNRYSHAMIWKGGKDWVLEFPDRNQWMLFKELYEECHNRNIRAACVKNIPIPGVRVVDESDDIRDEVPFVRDPTMYFRQIQTDAEMAMDPSYILYDMDSDDEQWLATQGNCTDKHKIEKISEEFFEMAINMFEKVSYSQQRDNLTDAEIEEVAIVIGSVEAAKLIYLHWRLKREQAHMPLIRHLQPPPWQRYQKQVKEWEHNVSRSIQEKISPPEKPPMFAFCFKPRGLDVPNRTSKQKSHRKFSVSAIHHASSGDHSLLFSGVTSEGRRSNGHAYGDEKILYAGGVHDSSDVSPSLHPSTRILSSRDAHFTLSASVSEWKVNNDRKVHKNKRKKKLRSYHRTATGDNSNGIQQWKMGPPELFSQRHYYLDGPHNQGGPKQPDILDLHEFHVRDALGASKHARTVAKLKREKAEKLFRKADFAIHKAVSALMQAEAIKDFFENSKE
ncbi:hypothetical protein OROGR_027075 [Orobanche gracilis]